MLVIMPPSPPNRARPGRSGRVHELTKPAGSVERRSAQVLKDLEAIARGRYVEQTSLSGPPPHIAPSAVHEPAARTRLLHDASSSSIHARSRVSHASWILLAPDGIAAEGHTRARVRSVIDGATRRLPPPASLASGRPRADLVRTRKRQPRPSPAATPAPCSRAVQRDVGRSVTPSHAILPHGTPSGPRRTWRAPTARRLALALGRSVPSGPRGPALRRSAAVAVGRAPGRGTR